MAKKIHPTTQQVTYQFSQGRTMSMPSTYKKSTFLLETDIFTHPAWREDQKAINAGSANVNKFAEKFGVTSFGGSFTAVNLKEEKKS
jgi:ribosomal protein L31